MFSSSSNVLQCFSALALARTLTWLCLLELSFIGISFESKIVHEKSFKKEIATKCFEFFVVLMAFCRETGLACLCDIGEISYWFLLISRKCFFLSCVKRKYFDKIKLVWSIFVSIYFFLAPSVGWRRKTKRIKRLRDLRTFFFSTVRTEIVARREKKVSGSKLFYYFLSFIGKLASKQCNMLSIKYLQFSDWCEPLCRLIMRMEIMKIKYFSRMI